MNKKRTSSSLKKITSSSIFWMAFSLLAAIILWTYVTTTEGVDTTKTIRNIKIEFLGADALRESTDLVVTEQDCTTVDAQFTGKRRYINKLTNSNVTATVDLARVSTDGRYTIALDYSFPSGVVADDISIVSLSTENINFYVDKITSKTVEVKGDFTGSTAEGYLSDETLSFDPMVVKISGPKTIINRVEHAYVSMTRENVDKSVSYSTTYILRDADGNEVDDNSIIRDVEEVNVSMNVMATKEVPLEVNTIDGAGALRDVNTTVTIEPASIMLAGEASAIDGTTKIIIGSVNLSSFATDYTTTFTIVPPDDTDNMTGITEATVTISVRDLSTKTVSIPADNFSCINVPEGFNAEIITNTLSVVIRGDEDVIAGIKDKDVRAVADLAELENPSDGVFTPAVKVYINGNPEAGIIGEYKIYIMLS